MKKGIHVLTEMPAALCAEDVTEMYRFVQEYKVKSMVAMLFVIWCSKKFFGQKIRKIIAGTFLVAFRCTEMVMEQLDAG